jgi:hypothetical protein
MYKKIVSSKLSIFLLIPMILFMDNLTENTDDPVSTKSSEIISTSTANNNNKRSIYQYPKFYKGIYLNVYSARKADRLTGFTDRAKKAGINTIVLDVQRGKNDDCAVPPQNVKYLIDNGIHPIARIMVFEDGLTKYPVPESIIMNRLTVAKNACKNGFREIQFDYIRFSDYRVSKRLSFKEKYSFIQSIINRAKEQLKEYNVKIAVDVFGRIPLNNNDAIGQKMEVFDEVADIICPMAYPSHYTWSNKMMSDPYYTVYITSKRARERTKNAEIVTYIQAFQIKIKKSKLTYQEYIEEQMKAVHDAKVRGFILWNAAQNYDVPFKVVDKFYRTQEEAYNININDKSS